jgi:guanidinoacetate N-methyltransferase
MTRRIKRFADFELAMNIKNPEFIRTPQEYQRNWLLNRSINEFASDIYALDPIASRFVKGSEVQGMEDRTQAELDDLEIMEDWQIPIMQAMAEVVTENRGDILEIGFGRGIGSSLIQESGTASHTIIECNHSIVGRFEQWKAQYEGQKIDMQVGLWQDVLPQLGDYDGIFFHTYPLQEADYVEQIANSSTFAEHFFEHAAAHLRKGGIFTYLSNEIDSLSRHHQRILFKHFDSIQLSVVKDLDLPEEVKDQWWADSMVIVKAVK